MPKVKTLVFVDRGVVDQYEALAAAAGCSRSAVMRHALVHALPEVRAAIRRSPGRFAVTASQPARPRRASAPPTAAAPVPASPLLDALRRHLQALFSVNPSLTVDELRAHAESELAHADPAQRPAVDVVDALVVELVEGSDAGLDPVPGDAPPV